MTNLQKKYILLFRTISWWRCCSIWGGCTFYLFVRWRQIPSKLSHVIGLLWVNWRTPWPHLFVCCKKWGHVSSAMSFFAVFSASHLTLKNCTSDHWWCAHFCALLHFSCINQLFWFWLQSHAGSITFSDSCCGDGEFESAWSGLYSSPYFLKVKLRLSFPSIM